MKMSKFYKVSKVLARRTDTNGRVQYLVRWASYGKAFDSLVDEEDTNDHLKQAFRTRFQSNLNTFFLRHASIPINYEFTLGSQMLNALTSHRCSPGSILSSDHTCGLSLLLVLSLLQEVFHRVLRFPLLLKNQHF